MRREDLLIGAVTVIGFAITITGLGVLLQMLIAFYLNAIQHYWH